MRLLGRRASSKQICSKDLRQVGRENHWERILYFVLMYCVAAFYFMLIANRFLSSTGAWSTFAWEQMKNGKVIYRDFYYYLPPLAVVMDGLMQELANYDVYVYRLLHLFLIRMTIISILYWVLTKFYPSKYVWISLVTCIILNASTPHDGMGDYNQNRVLMNVILIAISTAFFELPLSKRSAAKGLALLGTCGFMMGLILLVKHSSGVFTAFIYFCFLVFYCIVQRDKNFLKYTLITLGGFAIPVSIALVWLFANGALVPMIEQLFLKMDAKGDVENVLFGGLISTFTNYKAISVFSLLAIAALLIKWRVPQIKNFGRICSTVAVGFGVAAVGLFGYYHEALIASTVEAMSNTNYLQILAGFVVAISLVIGATALIKRLSAAQAGELAAERVIPNVVLAVLFAMGSAYAFTLSEDVLLYLNNNRSFYSLRSALPYISFFALLLAIVTYAWKWGYLTWNKKSGMTRKKALGALCVFVGFFAVVIEGAVTSTTGLSQGTLLCSLSVLLIMALNLDMKWFTKVKNVVLYSLCFLCISMCMVAKVAIPFNWYGHTSNTITGNQETVSVNVPGLEGFQLVPKEAKYYEEAYKLVTLNTEEEDFVFSFPHVVLFRILGDRINQPTFVLNYFFDTCGDYYAINDAEILKENLPEMVIWCDLGNSAWTTHERIFRGGNRLGQREIQYWFSSVMDTEYELIGQCGALFYYKRIGTPVNYTYFENSSKKNSTAAPLGQDTNPSWYLNGSGTETDPYRISNAKELVRFRDLVNHGVTFEGKYLLQTEDIDVSDEMSWAPIGIYGTGNYFYGEYDGAGHTISGLFVDRADNCGLFGVLGGTVMNLRLEDGVVKGACVGSIASHATGANARILNCYSNLIVTGSRAGGIADNFSGGEVSYCVFEGEANGTSSSAGIVSYSAREINVCQGKSRLFNGDLFKGTCTGSTTLARTAEERTRMVLTHALQRESDPSELIVWDDEGAIRGYYSAGAMFEGEGTIESPYLIHDEADLAIMRDLVNNGENMEGKYFLQTADIDLGNAGEWIPIGRYGSGNYFKGTYNGEGHVIRNMVIKLDENCALFSTLQGTVMNLGIEDFDIQGKCSGVIAGHGSSDARIVNCYAQNGVVSGSRTGGIVDNFSGTVITCWSKDVEMNSRSSVGDIAAYSVGKMISCSGFEQLYPLQHFSGKDYDNQLLNDDAEGIVKLVETCNTYNASIPKQYKIEPSSLAILEVRDGRVQFVERN